MRALGAALDVGNGGQAEREEAVGFKDVLHDSVSHTSKLRGA